VLAWPPTQSQRGGYVGAAAVFVNPAVFVHEIGHTIHWPHSYLPGNDDDPFREYTNPIDIMSGEPDADGDDPLEPPQYCHGTDDWWTYCWSQHTLAFNRLAAGWL